MWLFARLALDTYLRDVMVQELTYYKLSSAVLNTDDYLEILVSEANWSLLNHFHESSDR